MNFDEAKLEYYYDAINTDVESVCCRAFMEGDVCIACKQFSAPYICHTCKGKGVIIDKLDYNGNVLDCPEC